MVVASNWYRNYSPGIGFPLLLIIIGGIWLLKAYGYIPPGFPLIAWIIFGIGFWILLTRIIGRLLIR